MIGRCALGVLILLGCRGDVARRTLFLSGDIAGVAQELGAAEYRVLLKPIELTDLKQVLLALLAPGRPTNPHLKPVT